MAEIRAFKGIRYNLDKIGELSKVTAPPYDVLNDAQRDALAESDENNIVKLDEERKAAMVSNLLVVLCSDESAQPVLNTGSLYT